MTQTPPPGAPRVSHRGAALGLTERRPRLTWATVGDATGYEIEIATDGGTERARVSASAALGAEWIGPDLASREQRNVRVRATTSAGESPWSPTTVVEAGLLEDGDWVARFAEASHDAARPVLRRRFHLEGSFDRARLYLTFHGIGEARLNGARIGDEVLAPGWQHYPARLAVSTYDVGPLLREGDNVLEISLGDGWWAGRLGFTDSRSIYGTEVAALAQLEVHRDGRVEVVAATDSDMLAADGPTLAADLYDGETHDARRDLPADDDLVRPTAWSPVTLQELPSGVLRGIDAPPVRRQDVLAPVDIRRTERGSWIVDFGQNFGGWLRLSTTGPEGTVITVRHAEVLEGGELSLRPLRTAQATDRWILAGSGLETWEPRFTFHGFRYAEIDGWPEPTLERSAVRGIVVHSELERRGWFTTSHPALSRLHENVVWSMRSNFVSIPTDCPQRDERLGWTGDIAIFAPTAAFLYDVTAFLSSWLEDVAAEQTSDGCIPYFVPSVPFPEHLADNPLYRHLHTAVWGDACTLVPFALYEETGDIEILRRNWPTMRKWVDGVTVLAGRSRIWDQGFQFGDWLDPTAPPDAPALGATAPELVATAYFAHSAHLVARAATLLGDDGEAERFGQLAEEVRDAFRRRFVRPDGLLTSDSQSAYAIALQLDLVEDRTAAGERLVQLVRESGHLIGTGFVGTPLILGALTAAGALDDAYRLLLQTAPPSWLHAVTMGATTIWERWDSMLSDGTVNPGEMTSFNHYALGAVASWMHENVGGLSAAEPGWRRVRYSPRPHPEVASASATHLTPFGRAEIAWAVEGEDLVLDLLVPEGTTAVLELDGRPAEELPVGRSRLRRPISRPASGIAVVARS